MSNSRIVLTALAAIMSLSSLFASVRPSHADSGGLGLDWLSNKPYVECLKQARLYADIGNLTRGPAAREASYDRGRRRCNMQYYGHQ